MMDDLREKYILIVDDEPAFLELLEASLNDAGFPNIVTAKDGLECLSVLDQLGDKIYVILLDLYMPRMGGIDVMRHLVNVHKHAIGIVVLTAYTSLLSRNSFLSMGTDMVVASNYITKPYDLDEVLIELDKTLALIHNKRQVQVGTISNESVQNIRSVERQLSELVARIDKIEHKLPNLVAQLGLDVIRTILIGLLIIVAFYFGLGNFLAEIISKLK